MKNIKPNTPQNGRKYNQAKKVDIASVQRGPSESRKEKDKYRLGLSTCSFTYLKVLADPFISTIVEACIPDVIALPSRKEFYTAKGTFTVGTNTVGFVSMNPWNMIVANPTTNAIGTEAAICASVTGFNLPGSPVAPNSATPNVVFYSGNGLFSAGALNTNDLEFRLVGAGLRIRYIGSKLLQAGHVSMFRFPNNTPLGTGAPPVVSLTNALTVPSNHTSPVDSEKWCQITYAPSRTSDISYVSYDTPTVPGNLDYRIMHALIEGAPAGQSFEWEAVAFFEIVGGGVTVGLQATPSHSDPVGYSAVLSSLPNRLIAQGSVMLEYMKNGAMRALETSVSGLMRVGVQAVGAYFGGPAGGAIAGAMMSRQSGPTVSDID